MKARQQAAPASNVDLNLYHHKVDDLLKAMHVGLLRRADRDHLTCLLNWHGFDERLEVVCVTAKRYRRSVALFLLDIDHFKGINDCYGHSVGDNVLTAVAHELCDSSL